MCSGLSKDCMSVRNDEYRVCTKWLSTSLGTLNEPSSDSTCLITSDTAREKFVLNLHRLKRQGCVAAESA